MSKPFVSPFLDRPAIPAPPLPFEVVDDNGYIFVRRRDGKHYRPFEPMGVNPEEYRGKCEWLCDLLNEVHDFGALCEHKRTQPKPGGLYGALVDFEAAMDQLGKDIAELNAMTSPKQAAE